MGDDSTESADRHRLTGAEAIARLMVAAGVAEVFAYPGTSELALCDAVAEHADQLRLVNGRGDTESAFMAAGASLLRPNRGAAILHGARGLTNAAGAVADARRNEAGTVFFVGLATTASAPFLPPHGEPDLLGGMSAFADWVWQAPAVPGDEAERQVAAAEFVASVRRAFAAAAGPPSRPALFGLPQDVAEQRWIPAALLESAAPQVPAQPRRASEQDETLTDAVGVLAKAQRPLFLVDDYALRFPGIHGALDRISRATGALVLQVRYRRGPMMFERLRNERVANFAGWLEPRSEAHRRLLESCDLLVTVEDRNIYERVVGKLPAGPKIALNTDPAKVHKNGYLGAADSLIVGDPAASLDRLLTALAEIGVTGRPLWCPLADALDEGPGPEPADPSVVAGRRMLTRTLAEALSGWERPVLVDDSQMFGGLLSDHYDEFPVKLRAFGGHGGFVGSGLSLATGLALGEPDARVLCTLGDQAFTNSFQGLVAAVEQRARVLFVVCNNGRSVSLTKQAKASFGAAPRDYLDNVAGFEYRALAEAIGVHAASVSVPIGAADQDRVRAGTDELAVLLGKAAQIDGPALVEVVVPSDPAVWRGIWITTGFERSGTTV
ncbi:thiamine pyrophosphate-binding protein [Actinospica durhamensis]|nr:thiamine pyrophosphate-binding protein [Actinospica durhamensis]